MKRGDVLTVAVSGDYGKPRPAVVIQSDRLASVDSVVMCLFTSTLTGESPLRLPVAPDGSNSLRLPSEVMVEKIVTTRRDKCGPVVGHLQPSTMAELDRRLAFVIGLNG